MIDADTYTAVLRIMAPLLAALFWGVVWMLGQEARQHNNFGRRWGSIGWAAHAALYWTANAIARWFLGFTVPTYLFSLWAMIVFMHAGVSLLWMGWVLRHYPTPVAGPEIPEGWEGSNDD